MSTRRCTEEIFRNDVKRHEITVVWDRGVDRHLHFGVKGDPAMSYSLLTWQDHLCYTGDMGSFLFRKSGDMFDFFRFPRDYGVLGINPEYWAEKLLAQDVPDGAWGFSSNMFKKAVVEHIKGFFDDTPYEDQDRFKTERDCIEHARSIGLLDSMDEYESISMLRRVQDGEFEGLSDSLTGHYGVDFDDFFEDQIFDTPTYRFVWGCYAICWGIRQFDLMKQFIDSRRNT